MNGLGVRFNERKRRRRIGARAEGRETIGIATLTLVGKSGHGVPDPEVVMQYANRLLNARGLAVLEVVTTEVPVGRDVHTLTRKETQCPNDVVEAVVDIGLGGYRLGRCVERDASCPRRRRSRAACRATSSC